MIEIERKFLVRSNAFKEGAFQHYSIKQGFLNRDKSRTVRVRLKQDTGFITIKGPSSKNGISRFEWEKEITKNEAEALIQLCEPGIINKIRYEVKVGNYTFEVDEFFGDNEGLIVAEVELEREDEIFEKPYWLGEEVTNDFRYFNSHLSKNPYRNWHK